MCLHVGRRTQHGTTAWYMCCDSIINRTAFTSQDVRSTCHSPSIGGIVMATPTKAWSANWCLESYGRFVLFFSIGIVDRGSQ